MEQIRISNTRMICSRIGLSACAIGSRMRGGGDDQQAIATVRSAVARGVTLIDTAPVYGFGRAEEIMGKALSEAGRFLKTFIVRGEGRQVLAFPMAGDPVMRRIRSRSTSPTWWRSPVPALGHSGSHTTAGWPVSRRHQQLGYSPRSFVLRMSRPYIGNHVGISVETPSRVFSALSAGGLIETRLRTVVIKDVARLAAVLDGQRLALEANPDHARVAAGTSNARGAA
jgi:hypothetical protein